MTWQDQLPFFQKKQIQSQPQDPALICWQIPFDKRKVDRLTTIIVEEGQLAIFLKEQQIVAILEQGSYPWHWVFDAEPTLDILADLDLYYFSTKPFSDQRWGTATPLIIQDQQTGVFSLRCHGIFSYQLENPKILWRQLPNDIKQCSTAELISPLRALLLEQLAITLNNQINLKAMLKNQEALTQQIYQTLLPVFSKQYGLTLNTFLIQSISLPDSESTSLEKITQLEKLNELYKQGILTQEEFEMKKKALLKDL